MPRKPKAKPAAPAKKKVGRPEIPLTPELSKKITSAVAAGVPREFACALAEVSWRTVERWIKRGLKENRGKYKQFCRDFKKAEAVYVARTLTTIDSIGSGKHDSDHAPQWTAHAWRLERRFPRHFGRRDRMSHKIAGGANAAAAGRLVLVEGPVHVPPPGDMP